MNVYLKFWAVSVTIVFSFCKTHAQVNNQKIDTNISVNQLANELINKSIFDKSPDIKILIYLNGKIIKKGYTVSLIINDKNPRKIALKNLKLDTLKYTEVDSLVFLLSFRGQKIYSSKLPCKRFFHGGTFCAGIILDYRKERRAFDTDDNYFANNQQNKLYDLLNRTSKRDEKYLDKKYQLNYIILNSNMSNSFYYTYNFIPSSP